MLSSSERDVPCQPVTPVLDDLGSGNPAEEIRDLGGTTPLDLLPIQKLTEPLELTLVEPDVVEHPFPALHRHVDGVQPHGVHGKAQPERRDPAREHLHNRATRGVPDVGELDRVVSRRKTHDIEATRSVRFHQPGQARDRHRHVPQRAAGLCVRDRPEDTRQEPTGRGGNRRKLGGELTLAEHPEVADRGLVVRMVQLQPVGAQVDSVEAKLSERVGLQAERRTFQTPPTPLRWAPL